MRGGIQPYTAMGLGKAGALDDLMTHPQALHLRLLWHRKVAYVDLVFWVCVCLWARKLLSQMRARARQMPDKPPQRAGPAAQP
jgi:hypothetical protein